MDPCPFVRLVVSSLGLKFPHNHNHIPSTSYCKIKLNNQTPQVADVASYSPDHANQTTDQILASFSFKKSEFQKVNALKIQVFSNRKTHPICGVGSGKLLGVVSVGLNSKVDDNCAVIYNGWADVGSKKPVQLQLNVWVEPDPRFVFEFDDEPECSPQVFQVNGNVRQAVFSCKFSFRNNNLSASLSSSSEPKNKNLKGGVKERKGWSVTIHDLSGSPVAMASMVTPFVPSHGLADVHRSNPGAWLILRPAQTTWKPWARLEAWREPTGTLGYRFELIPEAGLEPINLTTSVVSSKHGRKFVIDIGNGVSPITTPTGSFDSGSDIWSGSWANVIYQGFVMSSKVSGGGGGRPEVEIGVQHVTCTEDAAAFVALAAAVDLSVDACQSFSKKLRKELRHDGK